MDLGNREFYDIATALRGPDHQCFDVLKWIFTARIRFHAGVSKNCPSLVRRIRVDENHFVRLEELAESARSMSTELHVSGHHYMSHVIAGLHSLAKHSDMKKSEYEALLGLGTALQNLFGPVWSGWTSEYGKQVHNETLEHVHKQLTLFKHVEATEELFDMEVP